MAQKGFRKPQYGLFLSMTILTLFKLGGALPADTANPATAIDASKDEVTATGQIKGDNLQTRTFSSHICELGLWEHWRGFEDRFHGAFEGRPLGDKHGTGDKSKCIPLKYLHENLPDQVSSLKVSGYCECEFFDDEHCKDTLFTRFNEESNKMWENPDLAQFDNRISSVRCWDTRREKSFKNCSVYTSDASKSTFQLLRKRTIAHMGVVLSNDVQTLPDLRSINLSNDYEDVVASAHRLEECITIRKEVADNLGRLEINGCTCNFYNNDNCEGDVLPERGINGNRGGSFKDYVWTYARSYKCFYPFGIPSAGREDGQLQEGIARLIQKQSHTPNPSRAR